MQAKVGRSLVWDLAHPVLGGRIILMYLITAKYTSDSERKRIEYALEKWRDRINIAKPEGLVAIVDDTEIQELVTDLYSRTNPRGIEIYRLQKTDFDIAEVEQQTTVVTKENQETAGKLMEFIMARQKAVLKTRYPGTNRNVYEVISRKGKAECAVEIIKSGVGSKIIVTTTGYGDTVDFLHARISEEIKLLEAR